VHIISVAMAELSSSLSMDIGLSATGPLLFHSRDCGVSHEITERKASNLAFMHDVPQQNLAKSNSLYDCQSIGWIFHGFLRPDIYDGMAITHSSGWVGSSKNSSKLCAIAGRL
jgi:hypothetical protein